MQHKKTPPPQSRKVPRLWSANRLDHYPADADRWLGLQMHLQQQYVLCVSAALTSPFWWSSSLLDSHLLVHKSLTDFWCLMSKYHTIPPSIVPALHSASCLRQRHKRVASWRQKQNDKREKAKQSEDKLPISAVFQIRSFYLVLEAWCVCCFCVSSTPCWQLETFHLQTWLNTLHVNKRKKRKKHFHSRSVVSALLSHQYHTDP